MPCSSPDSQNNINCKKILSWYKNRETKQGLNQSKTVHKKNQLNNRMLPFLVDFISADFLYHFEIQSDKKKTTFRSIIISSRTVPSYPALTSSNRREHALICIP